MDARVEVVQEINKDRFGRHRQLGAAVGQFAMMGDDHVLQAELHLGGERLTGQLLRLLDLVTEHFHAHDDVADQFAFIRVAERGIVTEFADLADVVQKNAHDQQIAVDARIDRRETVRAVHHGDDVFQEAADVGVMLAHTGGRPAKVAEKAFIHVEGLGQAAQVQVLGLEEHRLHAFLQLGDVLLGVGQEIGHVELFATADIDIRKDDLQAALKHLYFALGFDEVAMVDLPGQALGSVPQSPGQRAGTVAQLDLQKGLSLAIGLHRLVGDEEDFFKGIAIGELADVLARHEDNFLIRF